MKQRLSVSASAPGKLMLFGEHAVLYGELAIVCAINRRIRVRATRLDHDIISITSDLGEETYPLTQIPNNTKLPFVCEAVRELASQIECGIHLDIESDIPHEYGLGSSAATTAATVTAITRLFNLSLDPIEIFNIAKQALLRAQNGGSAADLAASVFGGTLAYKATPFACTRLQNDPTFCTIYSGSKTPTPDVIAKVGAATEKNPEKNKKIFQKMGSICKDATVVINQENWQSLGKLANKNQTLMQELGLENDDISNALAAISSDSFYGAKISGAGLGDCVIGFHHPDTTPEITLPMQLKQISLKVDDDGILYED
ncbi:MAG: mevalonate kinase [Candidatus Thioglobus sp.]